MKKLSLILIFCLSIAHASPKAYLKSTDEFFTTTYLVKDGVEVQFYEMGSSDELVEFFKDNKVSYKYINDYDSYITKANISLWGGLGLAVIYLLLNRDNFSPSIYFGTFGVGLFTSIYYNSKAKYSFYRALNTYNGVGMKLGSNSAATRFPKLGYTFRF